MTTQEYAYIAGSAHLDIIANVTDKADVVDKIGTMHYEFGGTAYNFAMNLQNSGVQTTFTGAFNQSPISQMILTEMMNNGIRTHVKTISSLPEAGFCAQLIQGDLFSAVSSMPVEQVQFSKQFFERGIKNAKCLILDCNLSVESLNTATKVANKHGVPVYIAGVSEAKCLRTLDIQHNIDVIFVNQREMNYLLKTLDDCQSWADISKKQNCIFVVTQGKDGVALCQPDGTVQNFSVQAIKVDVNTLGAGDMFTSTFIKAHAFEKAPLATAIEQGISAAAEVLKRQNASLGRAQAFQDNIESIASRAETDNLTKILNRDGLERFMKSRSLFDKPFFTILCDVDHFKQFNDTYGHDIGDSVLKQVSKVLQKCVRNKDAVGRWGGEEFVCIIDDKDIAVATRIAERIRKEVEKLNLKGVDHNITISAGVALSAQGHHWDAALKLSDQALYQAKSQGRNQVVVADV